ncbi:MULTISPECIES: YlbF family regulator [unclassified Paenibacillus]|uniref:YlbF family regulator n=1 Tax=Paenibacillus TaxID=44249 RepID=UPI000433E9EC|nr:MULTISPECIES: YlbF family regulator [unclassified Paenibacillus]KKC47350.1 hypothetical protein VE23_09610 [Paenibacillus sp. D9]CDN45749.1 UPF0342 protein Athe_0692 [Paenibacillus sp. P22]
MNVYDRAYELAQALQGSLEAKQVMEARAAADRDPDARRMLADFQRRQLELQQRMMGGEEPSAEELDGLGKLYELLSLNPLVQDYFEAEKRLGVVYEDVNRIIGSSMQSVLLP